MTFVRSKNISLKYQRFTTLGSKDIGIRKSEFVAKSQFFSGYGYDPVLTLVISQFVTIHSLRSVYSMI